jgi:hypothetical protein
MNRNYLTGREGDKINAVLSAAGYNLRKLLRWVVFAPIFWLRWWLTARLAVVIGPPAYRAGLSVSNSPKRASENLADSRRKTIYQGRLYKVRVP